MATQTAPRASDDRPFAPPGNTPLSSPCCTHTRRTPGPLLPELSIDPGVTRPFRSHLRLRLGLRARCLAHARSLVCELWLDRRSARRALRVARWCGGAERGASFVVYVGSNVTVWRVQTDSPQSRREARLIFIRRAAAILSRYDAGDDFASLARTRGGGAASASRGGGGGGRSAEWTRLCVRHADTVLLVVDARAGAPRLSPRAEALLQRRAKLRKARDRSIDRSSGADRSICGARWDRSCGATEFMRRTLPR